MFFHHKEKYPCKFFELVEMWIVGKGMNVGSVSGLVVGLVGPWIKCPDALTFLFLFTGYKAGRLISTIPKKYLVNSSSHVFSNRDLCNFWCFKAICAKKLFDPCWERRPVMKYMKRLYQGF